MKILGIYREANKGAKINEDRRIADAVERELKAKGHSVRIVNEFDYYKGENAIFSLSRSHTTLNKLERLERQGVFVINSPKSVRICINRKAVFEKFINKKIPVPNTEFHKVDSFKCSREYPFFIKNGEKHFGYKDETFIIKKKDDLRKAINYLSKNGTKEVLVQGNVTGKQVKLYGIGKKIIHKEETASKSGLSSDEIKKASELALKASKVLKTKVFGADIIIRGGKVKLIDFNEWPSFSSVRNHAAKSIAELIEREAITKN